MIVILRQVDRSLGRTPILGLHHYRLVLVVAWDPATHGCMPARRTTRQASLPRFLLDDLGQQLRGLVRGLSADADALHDVQVLVEVLALVQDRKSTRLNSSHVAISYAV